MKMKRSEFERIIRDTLKANGYVGWLTSAEEMASYIAYELEVAGVQAPPTTLDILFPDSDLKDTEEHLYNVWEPENDGEVVLNEKQFIEETKKLVVDAAKRMAQSLEDAFQDETEIEREERLEKKGKRSGAV